MRLVAAALLLCACGDDRPPVEPDSSLTPLDPVARLVRASEAVRGIRPSLEEIELVQAAPEALDHLVDTWLASPEFAATIRDMWAEILLMRNDTFNQLPVLGLFLEPPYTDDPDVARNNPDLILADIEHLYQGTVEEPLKLIEHVVMNDLPFTEIVTAQYMLTDDVTATMYGVPYDYDLGGWQISEWPDARPRAGLLSSAQLYRRWESDGSNFNRGRANMVGSRLLCEPFENRDIQILQGINVADEDEVAQAVLTKPECVACHQSLDSLGAYFWGYKKLIHRNYVADSHQDYDCGFDWAPDVKYVDGKFPEFGMSYLPADYCYPLTQYTPSDEDDWMEWGLRAPSYYGTPARDLAEVGQLIADDPRFSMCMAKQFFGYLSQMDTDAVPFDIAAELQDVFESSGFDAKALVKAAVLNPQFGALGYTDETNPVPGLRTIRPEQYARTVEDLTGYRWWGDGDPMVAVEPTKKICMSPQYSNDVARFGSMCWNDVDLSVSDVYGFRSMAGGVDGKVVLRPTRSVTPTKTLVMGQLAADAAGSVVDSDFAVPAAERRLLTGVEGDTTDETSIRNQLVVLHARILGEIVPADSEVVTSSFELFTLGQQTAGAPAGGWKLVLTALLQDPRMMFF